MKIWPAKFPAERVLAKFDFRPEMPGNDVIQSAVCSVTQVIGEADENTSAVLDGSVQIHNNKSVLQWLNVGSDACVYEIRCQATTQQGKVLVLVARLPVKDS